MLKLHDAVDDREQGIIFRAPHVDTRVNFGAALANDDVASPQTKSEIDFLIVFGVELFEAIWFNVSIAPFIDSLF